MRARYQVLVLPYRRAAEPQYCIFKRSDLGCWQFVSGGGETEDDSVLTSARRETFEEAGIRPDARFTALETTCSISTEHFAARTLWGDDCLVIPEHSFAVGLADGDEITISHEHTVFEWVDYATALARLRYDSNKVALWELHNKLKMGLI